jgi:hypothetical protein
MIKRRRSMSKLNGIYSSVAIKRICLDAGADDVGLVDLERDSLVK